jgi:alkanesulfonate monooxygenase SsuD/methylene tetrahydromethanopterin reductase-like flavin-dependent oxidoreductase (luciferase family)
VSVIWHRRRGGQYRGIDRPGLRGCSPRVHAALSPEAIAYQYSPQERVIVEANRQRHFIGTPFKVASTIRNLVNDTGADEIMVTSMMYGRDARFRAYEMLANEWGPRSDQDT